MSITKVGTVISNFVRPDSDFIRYFVWFCWPYLLDNVQAISYSGMSAMTPRSTTRQRPKQHSFRLANWFIAVYLCDSLFWLLISPFQIYCTDEGTFRTFSHTAAKLGQIYYLIIECTKCFILTWIFLHLPTQLCKVVNLVSKDFFPGLLFHGLYLYTNQSIYPTIMVSFEIDPMNEIDRLKWNYYYFHSFFNICEPVWICSFSFIIPKCRALARHPIRWETAGLHLHLP